MTDRTQWGRRKYLVFKDIETVNEIERLTIRDREIQEDDKKREREIEREIESKREKREDREKER